MGDQRGTGSSPLSRTMCRAKPDAETGCQLQAKRTALIRLCQGVIGIEYTVVQGWGAGNRLGSLSTAVIAWLPPDTRPLRGSAQINILGRLREANNDFAGAPDRRAGIASSGPVVAQIAPTAIALLQRAIASTALGGWRPPLCPTSPRASSWDLLLKRSAQRAPSSSPTTITPYVRPWPTSSTSTAARSLRRQTVRRRCER